MGFLDEVAGGLLKHVFSGQDTQGGMLQVVTGFLKNSESGGIESLVQTFKDKGLGDVISSWISQGENLPISPSQIQEVLGSDNVEQMAEKLGVSSIEASRSFAEMLPQTVDKLTPNGCIPAQDVLRQGLGMITEKFFGK